MRHVYYTGGSCCCLVMNTYLPTIRARIHTTRATRLVITDYYLHYRVIEQGYDDLGKEVIRLREEKYQLQLEDAEKEGMRKKLTELEETMDEIGGQVTEYYDALVRRLIERITVHDNRYVVEFKSGIEIDVRL